MKQPAVSQGWSARVALFALAVACHAREGAVPAKQEPSGAPSSTPKASVFLGQALSQSQASTAQLPAATVNTTQLPAAVTSTATLNSNAPSAAAGTSSTEVHEANPAEPVTEKDTPKFGALAGALGHDGTQVSGCLALTAERQETENRTHTATRASAPNAELQVVALGTSVLLAHKLTHACCLKAHTTTQVKNQVISVTETLTGSPCRCLCDSELKTRVTVKPGDYNVRLNLVYQGSTTTQERAIHVNGSLRGQ